MEKISKQARAMVEEAQREADAIIAKAQREAADMRARVLEKWFPSSYKVARGTSCALLQAGKKSTMTPISGHFFTRLTGIRYGIPICFLSASSWLSARTVTIEEVREARRQAGAQVPMIHLPAPFTLQSTAEHHPVVPFVMGENPILPTPLPVGVKGAVLLRVARCLSPADRMLRQYRFPCCMLPWQ